MQAFNALPRSFEQPESKLSQERLDSDEELEKERRFLDETMSAIERYPKMIPGDPAVLIALKNRIRRYRERFDVTRKLDRDATDDALREAASTADIQDTARKSAEVERESDRDDASQKLWRMLPDIDLITTAV